MGGLIAFVVTIALGAILIRAAWPGEPGRNSDHADGSTT